MLKKETEWILRNEEKINLCNGCVDFTSCFYTTLLTEGQKKVAVLSNRPREKVKLTHTHSYTHMRGPYLPKATEREKSE